MPPCHSHRPLTGPVEHQEAGAAIKVSPGHMLTRWCLVVGRRQLAPSTVPPPRPGARLHGTLGSGGAPLCKTRIFVLTKTLIRLNGIPGAALTSRSIEPNDANDIFSCVCIGLWPDQLPRVWRGMLLVDYIGSERSQRPFGRAAATRSILNLVTCPHLRHHQQLTKKSLHSNNSPL